MGRWAVGLAVPLSVPAAAQDAGPAEPPIVVAAPAPPPLQPSLAGPLAADRHPMHVDLGALGTVYVTGVVAGVARGQDHAAVGDRGAVGDVSNTQLFVQKADGVVQFFAEAGVYAQPSLGTAYLRATHDTGRTFGPVPVAYVKLAPTADFSVQAGKLPSLVGAESVFTFQNPNIDRGLLWNLTPSVSRGVQASYAHGRLAVAVSLSDGFYSGRWSTLSGSVGYALDAADVLTFIGSGNTAMTARSTFVTPGVLNNSQIYDLILTRTAGPWVIAPYLQYSYVATLPAFGTTAASAFGGAVLARYSFSPRFALPVRVEYVRSSGARGGAAANFLYGAGSDAVSVTVTPTYQYRVFFVRAEASIVAAGRTTGAVFGALGNDRSQTRGVLEAGVLF